MTIKKGTHAPMRFPVVVTSSEIARVVQFTPSCRYDIGSDQSDINKLFGVGYLPHHHTYSARFGWRYDTASDMIEILAYWYDKGERLWESMKFVAIGSKNIMVLRRHENMHEFYIGKERLQIDLNSCEWGFLLQPYFGGNRVAPHDITINISHVK